MTASCVCEPQRIVGGCAICNGASVVSDARLEALIRVYDNRVEDRVAPTDEEVLTALRELRQLRALAQTRQFGEREG